MPTLKHCQQSKAIIVFLFCVYHNHSLCEELLLFTMLLLVLILKNNHRSTIMISISIMPKISLNDFSFSQKGCFSIYHRCVYIYYVYKHILYAHEGYDTN